VRSPRRANSKDSPRDLTDDSLSLTINQNYGQTIYRFDISSMTLTDQ
jgi:hypothetical protein